MRVHAPTQPGIGTCGAAREQLEEGGVHRVHQRGERRDLHRSDGNTESDLRYRQHRGGGDSSDAAAEVTEPAAPEEWSGSGGSERCIVQSQCSVFPLSVHAGPRLSLRIFWMMLRFRGIFCCSAQIANKGTKVWGSERAGLPSAPAEARLGVGCLRGSAPGWVSQSASELEVDQKWIRALLNVRETARLNTQSPFYSVL
ncbi:hypothetical protein NQZ68_021853 [Dissostichus eleginoides]|nr:hypothetical protein NQZ68_021853 [Dissostichus eleginoides]